jgi:lysine-N-methylase
MPFPLRHLPVIQNYDCHACGNCCTDYWVPVSEEERQRIEAQAWDKEPDFQGQKLFVKYGPPWRRRYRLNQRAGDRCIFLDEKGLCRIHAKFGFETKPFACRLYPYILVPFGDHWRLSMRFACPSAAANAGRPLTQQLETLDAFAKEMEAWDERPGYRRDRGPELGHPPPLQGRQRVPWGDLALFVKSLVELLSDRRDPFVRRLIKCLALVRMCKEATFEEVTGGRLREFLNLLARAVDAEVPRNLDRIKPPSWIGRILFRTSVAVFIRKDQGVRRGVSRRGRLALMRAMWHITRGRGALPLLQVGLPEKTFEELEAPVGPASTEIEEALERYFVVKTESMQFCGPTNFHVPFWEGFEMLALLLPMMCWLARGYRDMGPLPAMLKAITVIDENFGYNTLLGKNRFRLGIRILSFRQELERLAVWYAR